MPPKNKSLSVPVAMQPRYKEIVTLTDMLCQEQLNSEYAALARALTAALARKRPSPLIGGRAKTWACGIIHTIGFVNFLFDKTQSPHMRAGELYAWFGVASSTGGNKAKQIRDLMRISRFDSKWMLPSMIEKSALVWMVSVNGLIMDARSLPFPLQEEAYRKGLIPYVPGDIEPEK
ncbi:MAG: DUF6398 domain-containing protein [Anaerolineaceae bacterium]|nr:DUF6398 domain-containing protein [Anaerolineaceae bacterium]